MKMSVTEAASSNTPLVWAKSLLHDARAWRRFKNAAGISDRQLEKILYELIRIAEDDGEGQHGLET